MSQLNDLVYALHEHTFDKQEDEAPVADALAADPMAKSFERAEFLAAGGTEAEWEATHSTPDSGFAKLATQIANRLGFSGEYGSAVGRGGRSLAKRAEERLEKRADEPAHADGTEIEECGKQTWKYVYKDGKCVRMECEDPDLPGRGRLYFDGDGNELGAEPLEI